MSQGKYTFMLEDESGYGIMASIPEGESFEEMLDHFKNFLFACGYKLDHPSEG